jgi:hypothetical protein
VADGTKLCANCGKGIKGPASFDQLDSLYALLLLPGSRPAVDQFISQGHISPIEPENLNTYDWASINLSSVAAIARVCSYFTTSSRMASSTFRRKD